MLLLLKSAAIIRRIPEHGRELMRHLAFFLVAAFLTIPLSEVRAQRPQQSTSPNMTPMVLSATSGTVPLTVTVVGPPALVKKLRAPNNQQGGWSTDAGLDWGDGTTIPDRSGAGKPVDPVTHVYTLPGTYTVSANLHHFGPDDDVVTDWRSDVTLTARASAAGTRNSDSSTRRNSVEIVSPTSKGVFRYQEFPDAEIKFSADRPVKFAAFLLDARGTILGGGDVHRSSVRTASGARSLRLSFTDFTPYDNSVRKGNTRFRILVRMLDTNNQLLAFAHSALFTMTPEATWSNMNIETNPANPKEVTLSYKTLDPKCFSYILDWGDGRVQSDIKKVRIHCVLEERERQFKHTYGHPGLYTVKMRTNEIDTLADPTKLPYYETLTVDVPGK